MKWKLTSIDTGAFLQLSL